MRLDVAIRAVGMCTAVGLTAASSAAAIRARVDGFQETRFMARGGAWVVGAEVPLEEPWRGLPRLARLVAGPVRECLDQAPDLPPQEIPLLVAVPEPDRPGRPPDLDARLLPEVEALLGVRFHPASALVVAGRGSLPALLREADRLVRAGTARRVVVAGTDSLLHAATIRGLDEGRRLLTDGNSNGLIPGEAGAALLLGPGGEGGTGPQVRLAALGTGLEPAAPGNDQPLRGDGMAAAFRECLGDGGLALADIDYRVADLDGTQFGFREAELAMLRLLRGRHGFIDLWHPADCIGAVGAAAGPSALAVAWLAARKGHAPGPAALLHGAADDGGPRWAVLARTEGG